MRFTWLGLLAIWVFAFAYYAVQQPQRMLNGGVGGDNTTALELAEQACSGAPLSGPAPFALRIGLPLAACGVHEVTGLPLRKAALALGVLLAFGSLVLLFEFLRFNRVRTRVALLFSALYVVHISAPLRESLFDPFVGEGAIHFFLLLGLLLVQRRVHWAWLLLYTPPAVATREIMLMFPLLHAFFALRGGERSPAAWARGVLPLLAGVAVLAWTRSHVLIVASNDFLTGEPYSFFEHALATVYKQTYVRPVFALCLAFGPLLWLGVHGWKIWARTLREERVFVPYVAVIAVLAFAGGTDTHRFVFWAFPVVYLLCSRAWQELAIPRASRWVTVALALVSEHVFWRIPYKVQVAGQLCRELTPCAPYPRSPAPFLHFLTDNYQDLDLHPYWGTRDYVMLALTQHLLCIALLVFVQRVTERVLRSQVNAAE